MASQIAVAHSRTVRGVGVFAGGPFYCVGIVPRRAERECMTGAPDPAASRREAERLAALKLVDPTDNLKQTRSWVLAGSGRRGGFRGGGASHVPVLRRVQRDGRGVRGAAGPGARTADPRLRRRLQSYRVALPQQVRCRCRGGDAGPPAAIRRARRRRPGPPADASTRTSSCPCCGACGARPRLTRSGTFTFRSSARIDAAACTSHCTGAGRGRRRSATPSRATPATTPGPRRTILSSCIRRCGRASRRSSRGGGRYNPRGCWDWWGYTGTDYATRNGVQIATIVAMVARLGQPR